MQPAVYTDLSRRRLVLTMAGLVLSMLLAALDQTIVGTAMPRIVAELHGFDHYAWVSTAYLLASTAVVPIVGKLSDMYGYRRFMLGGAVFFLGASMLCGLAQDMVQLSLFRGLQGIGGGVLMATIFTVVSVLFPPRRRGLVQGIFGAVFGLASIGGPLLGGYLTDALNWRWVFYVNLPLGLIALLVLWRAFPNIRPAGERRAVDIAGAALLMLAIVPLLLALTWGGHDYAWGSPQIVGLVAFGLLALVGFLVVEARAEAPIIPLDLLSHRVVGLSLLTAMLAAMGMFGTVLFLPLFVQAVLGANATQSGSVVAPMMLGMIVGSIGGGQLINRTGRYRLVALVGAIIGAGGMFMLSGMGPDTDYWTITRNMVLVGLGLGPTMPALTLAAQNAGEPGQIGVLTSLSQFFRSIGGTLGAALMGSVLANRFGAAFQASLPPEVLAVVPPERLAQLQNPQALLDPHAAEATSQAFGTLGAGGAQIASLVLETTRLALAHALGEVFLLGALVVAAGAVCLVFLPELPLRTRGRAPANAVESHASAQHPARTPDAA